MHLVAGEPTITEWQSLAHQLNRPLDGLLALWRLAGGIRSQHATGVPRRVITTVSPFSASLRTREKDWFASRALIDRMAAPCSVQHYI